MAGESLGDAFISIHADAAQFPSQVKSAAGSAFDGLAAKASSAGKTAGTNLTSAAARSISSSAGALAAPMDRMFASAGRSGVKALETTVNKGIKPVATAMTGVLSVAIAKGFSRLTAIDNAQKKLSGLGHSAETITEIMANAGASVRGTAFGLGDAATVSASAVAAGIKPGKELERTLKLVADAATIGGTSLNDMGTIFNKVAGTGKIQGEVFAQLGERGIPILQFLSKELGKSTEEVFKMGSEGKINFEMFQRAMESGLGGAAKSSGDTFSGAMANVMASLGRVGANLMSGFFPKMAPLFQAITKALGPFEEQAKGLGAAIADKVNPVIDVLTRVLERGLPKFEMVPGVIGPAAAAFAALGASGLAPVLNMVPGLGGLATKLGLLGSPLGLAAAGFLGLVAVSPELQGMIKVLADMAMQIGKNLAPYLSDLGSSLLPVFVGALQLVGSALATLLPWVTSLVVRLTESEQSMRLVGDIAIGLAVAYGTLKAIQMGATAVTWLQTAAMKAQEKGAAGVARALWAQVAAQLGLNAAMLANPITWIIIGIVALVAAIVVLWRNNEKFRNAMITAWNAIKAALGAVWDWLKGTLWPGMVWIWDGIKAGASSIAGAFSSAWGGVKSAWDAVSGVFSTVVETISGALSTVVSSVVSFATSVWQQFTTIVNYIAAPFRAAFESIWNVISPPLETARKIIEVFVAAGIMLFTSVYTWISGTFSTLFSGAWSWLQGQMNAILGIFTAWWNGVVAIYTALWTWISGTFRAWWGGLVTIFNTVLNLVIGAVTTWWNNVRNNFTALWTWVSVTFRSWWNTLTALLSGPMNTARNAISTAWTAIKGFFNSQWVWVSGVFMALWNTLTSKLSGPVDKARAAIDTALGKMKTGFENTVKNIGKAWDGLKAALGAPVKAAANIVVNPMIRTFNKLADKVKMPQNKLDEWNFKGFEVGGYTGRLPVNRVAGVVHGDEHVIRSQSRRKIEARHPGWLDYMNRTGRIPGYKSGGRVSLRGHTFTAEFAKRILAAEKLIGAMMSITQGGFRPTTSYSGTSHAGDALDIAGGGYERFIVPLRKVGIATWDRRGKGNWIAHAHGVPLPGAGSAGGSAVWQAQDYLRGGDGLGGRDTHQRPGVMTNIGDIKLTGIAGVVNNIFGKFSSAIDWLKDGITAPLKRVGEITSMGAFGGIIGSLPKQIASGMLSVAGNVFDVSAGVAEKGWNAAKAVGASLKSLFPGRGYAEGTKSAIPGWAWVGERGPELVNFRGGERVLTARQSRRASGASVAQSFGDVNVTLNMDDLEQLKTLEDFLNLLTEARPTARQTVRSGKVSD